jgi:hypothetical protein
VVRRKLRATDIGAVGDDIQPGGQLDRRLDAVVVAGERGRRRVAERRRALGVGPCCATTLPSESVSKSLPFRGARGLDALPKACRARGVMARASTRCATDLDRIAASASSPSGTRHVAGGSCDPAAARCSSPRPRRAWAWGSAVVRSGSLNATSIADRWFHLRRGRATIRWAVVSCAP